MTSKNELINLILQSLKLSSGLYQTPNTFTFYKDNLYFLVKILNKISQ